MRPGLRDLLAASTVVGAELDTDFRVLALTVERPGDAGTGGDPRRQVLLHPIGEFAASLRRADDDGLTLLTFGTGQLAAVVARFEGAPLRGDPLPERRPNRGAWGPRLSLQGSSAAPDGRAHHLHLQVELDGMALDLHATFDEAEVRDARGNTLDV